MSRLDAVGWAAAGVIALVLAVVGIARQVLS